MAGNKRRVLVFGAGGFSGRHFERFVAGEDLASAYSFFGHTRDAARAEQTGCFGYLEGDPLQEGEAARAIAEVRPHYVLNVAGRFRGEPDDFMKLHVNLARDICEAVTRAAPDCEKIVLAGSAAEYGAPDRNPVSEDAPARPISWYGLSKLYQTLLADYYFRNHGTPTVVARTFNILGEGLSEDLSIGSFAAQIDRMAEGGVLKVGNVGTQRDFLDIGEVVRRYWTLLLKGAPGQVYNICSGRPRTIRSVLDDMIEKSNKHIDVAVDPDRLKFRDIDVIYGDGSKFAALAG